MPRGKYSSSLRARSGRKKKSPEQPAAAAAIIQFSPADTLEPPAWLTDVAKAKFREMIDSIKVTGVVITTAHVDAIASYAEAWEDFLSAQASIDQHGAEIWGADQLGNTTCKANPAVRRKNQAHNRIRQIWTRFGMTPADQACIKLPPAENKKQEGFGQFVG